MLKIVGREAVRAAYVVNRVKVFLERMQFPKTEATSINLGKKYMNLRMLANDVEAYQDASRVRNRWITYIDC